MARYRPESACEKCGNTTAATVYCGGAGDREHVAGCEESGEHLHRTCARCGYRWLEDTLNTAS
jgi:predicted nucleic-acid-binding Zn-ribbon protein